LIAAVLPLRSLELQGALEIVRYHIRRNDIAYRSHEKKANRHAQRMNAKRIASAPF
jgi:hypothetical protein